MCKSAARAEFMPVRSRARVRCARVMRPRMRAWCVRARMRGRCVRAQMRACCVRAQMRACCVHVKSALFVRERDPAPHESGLADGQ